MKKQLTILVDENVLLRFNMALELNNHIADDVCERLLKTYISESFSKEAMAYSTPQASSATRLNVQKNAFYGKAINKISNWAVKPSQVCYKIIRAYLQLSNEQKYVRYDDLSTRCSNETEYPDVYVTNFDVNFAQLKIDSEKSYGKVFSVDEKGIITVWDFVRDEISKYRENFLRRTPSSIGYVNKYNQENIGKAKSEDGDTSKKHYKMHCIDCGNEYYVSADEISQKKCPKCQRG